MQMTELVAGRELDAMVAEKIMGWYITRTLYGNPYGAPRGHTRELGVPLYSTDIARAWQVVDKLRERFPQVDIEILPDRVTVTLWEQCRHDGGALDPLDEVVADTTPLAICRAALAAVSHD